MPINLTNPVVELALVTRQPEVMLRFYRDTLGLDYESQFEFPVPSGNQDLGVPAGRMHRLRCGGALIKLITPDNDAPQPQPATEAYASIGFRFITLVIDNLDTMLQKCASDGGAIPVSRRAFDDNIEFAFISDPDGNWIELVQYRS